MKAIGKANRTYSHTYPEEAAGFSANIPISTSIGLYLLLGSTSALE